MTQGFDAEALARFEAAIQADVDAGLYDGAVVKIARHGELAVDTAIGFADRAAGRAMAENDVFKVYSLTKAFTNALVLQAIDHGKIALTTRVVDVIPEFFGRDKFRSAKKDQINVGHLLTHRAGLPSTPNPLGFDQLHDFDAVVDAVCQMDVVGTPGEAFSYSPTVNHVLMAEIVRRSYGAEKTVREIMGDEIFTPLGMTSSGLGVIDAHKDRIVPVVSAMPHASWITDKDTLDLADTMEHPDAVLPWVGALTTAGDVFRFAEMLRQGGSLEGVRLLSPAIIDKASTLQTGDAINDLYHHLAQARGWETPPGNMGLGFALGGAGMRVTQFGTMSSARTFGNFGAGSTLFWVDPERQITFVCLTAKVIEESQNIERFQRLSDMVLSAAL
nr:serine hydrolase domain-containing protein [uncultured Celeribacter sp.]